jgi:hypothetical protein
MGNRFRGVGPLEGGWGGSGVSKVLGAFWDKLEGSCRRPQTAPPNSRAILRQAGVPDWLRRSQASRELWDRLADFPRMLRSLRCDIDSRHHACRAASSL